MRSKKDVMAICSQTTLGDGGNYTGGKSICEKAILILEC